MGKRKTTEEFKKDAKKVHGDEYIYDKAIYTNAYTNLTIICRKHGEFFQKPNQHLLGHGCPKCADEKRLFHIKKRAKTTNQFIDDAITIHGNLFDYSKVDYEGSNSKITIICPEHGEFRQWPSDHLRGCGCPSCGHLRAGELRKLTVEEFKERASKIHKNFYDYSKIKNYKNAFTHVPIICPNHGEFSQRSHDHLCGAGCPKCKSSKLENKIRELLNDRKIKFEEQKSFSWLIGPRGGVQTLDFYLSELNIGIECQGRQHFFAVDYFGGEENLKYTQECDQNKQDLCKAHGIDILYYSNLSTPDNPYSYPYKVHEDLEEIMNIIKTKLQTLTK